MLRVLIADDQRLFVDAVEVILGSDDRIDVVGRAHDGHHAVALARELRPDVVVMDLSMPGLDGFLATAAILGEEIGARVVVLSGSADPADIDRARQAGAAGYVLKENIAGELVERILQSGS